MNLRNRIMIAYVGMLVLLLLLAAVSLSLTSRYDRTIAGTNLEHALVISYSTQTQAKLPKFTAQAMLAPRSPLGQADYEREFSAIGAKVAALCTILESLHGTPPHNNLRQQWTEFGDAIRSARKIEDAEERAQFFARNIIPAGDSIRTVLADAVEASLSDMQSDTLYSRGQVRDIKLLLLTITLLGIVLCVGFLAVLRNLLRKPAQELVQMIDSVTASSHLNTPKAISEEVSAVVSALECLLEHVRETRRSDLLMLIQAERRAEHAMDCIPDALALANKSGEILYSNKTMVALLGKRPERISDLPWAPLMKIIDASMTSATPQVHVNFDRAIQLFLEGTEKFYLPGAYPLVSEEGSVEEIVILMNDVSYLKQLDEMKVDLVATVSHQLKTPLTSIRMSLHLLNANVAQNLTPSDMELVSTALEEAERLHETIQSLLDMARIQSGAIKMNFEPVDTCEWFWHIGESYREMLLECGIGLSMNIAPPLPSLHLDLPRMAAVIENLMTNAAKHCRPGDSVALHAATEPTDQSIINLCVCDTGPGIEASEVARIFEPFYQGATHGQGGTGLGLTIARKIVQAHGGEMVCRSVVGEGTKFVIRLYSGLM